MLHANYLHPVMTSFATPQKRGLGWVLPATGGSG